jgi:hypothetical protein
MKAAAGFSGVEKSERNRDGCGQFSAIADQIHASALPLPIFS